MVNAFMFFGFIFICLPSALLITEFIHFLLYGKRFFVRMFRVLESVIMLLSLLALFVDHGSENNCCGETAFFSPAHRASVYTLVVLCSAAYFYCSYKKTIAPPITETIANCLLLAGIVLNAFIALQNNLWGVTLFFNIPVAVLFFFVLLKNHHMLLAVTEVPPDDLSSPGILQRFCWDLLHLRLIHKIPILLVLCIPILVLIGGILLIFGQQPDSLLRAFTDTYRQGLSQWTSHCDKVVCGDNEGHFLCTIAAKGHSSLVRPIRSGIRGGRKIICNRQLLVSNAFEEWLEQRLPRVHRPIRQFYNRVGRAIHRHGGWFDRRWVSDTIYILMKPLEWCFVLILYTFDTRPEDRIAQQYMARSDRRQLVLR